ncbi:MAG: hypothetical protein JEZ10_03115 [Verrucomicrobia bacterium]|nr:hypothetical protein [Verrucomicrobiota bacterium]
MLMRLLCGYLNGIDPRLTFAAKVMIRESKDFYLYLPRRGFLWYKQVSEWEVNSLGVFMKSCVRRMLFVFVFTIISTNVFAVWQTMVCPDGRIVAIAPGGVGYCGRDGRTVSVPAGWDQETGPDQRLVAIPPQGRAQRGGDGRVVAVPQGWRFKSGPDGRGVAVPPGGAAVRGKDYRLVAVPEGWTTVEGKDGRVVAVPPDGTTAAGSDERIIAIPKGWTSAKGADNRVVAIPPGGEFAVGTDQRATPIPEDNFDLTDYVTLYCILGAQSESLAEEEADASD